MPLTVKQAVDVRYDLAQLGVGALRISMLLDRNGEKGFASDMALLDDQIATIEEQFSLRYPDDAGNFRGGAA